MQRCAGAQRCARDGAVGDMIDYDNLPHVHWGKNTVYILPVVMDVMNLAACSQVGEKTAWAIIALNKAAAEIDEDLDRIVSDGAPLLGPNFGQRTGDG